VDAPLARWRQNLKPLLDDMADGRIKMYLLWQSLALRQRWPEVFRDGEYLPLNVIGKHASHVFAFARRTGTRAVITVVPRLPARLLGNAPNLPVGLEVWDDTGLELPPEWADLKWNNVLSGEFHATPGLLSIGQLLSFFPVALLTAEITNDGTGRHTVD